MSQRICSIPGCEKRTFSRTWCRRHYGKWSRYGDPLHVSQRDKSPEVRFWEKVTEVGDCWEWTGNRDREGYGAAWTGASQLRAHRYAYEMMVGQIPEGLQLDHLCRNTSCVNPYHLDPVTPRVNTNRARALITHCPRGHVYDEENTRLDKSGARKCRACARERQRARYHREK